jgi:hypothetical protein
VIEKGLIGLLGLIAEFSALKERGIDKIFPLMKGASCRTLPLRLPVLCPRFRAPCGVMSLLSRSAGVSHATLLLLLALNA